MCVVLCVVGCVCLFVFVCVLVIPMVGSACVCCVALHVLFVCSVRVCLVSPVVGSVCVCVVLRGLSVCCVCVWFGNSSG